MYMEERKWKLAYEEFYESFRGYQVCFKEPVENMKGK